MTELRIEFEDGETYETGGSPEYLGTAFGYGSLEGYRFGEDGMIVLDFGGGKLRKVPARRLLRITEK